MKSMIRSLNQSLSWGRAIGPILAFAIALALTLPAFATVTVLSSGQAGDVTNRQAIIRFTVTNPANCSLVVYYDAAKTIKANDTNATLFPGSETCNRTYNTVTGTQVSAVIGRGTSVRSGADGISYSLALELAHTYYFTITDLTDSSTGTGSFTTANIPWGRTSPEEVPFCSDTWNHWCYPDLDWSPTGLTKFAIDPMTGVQVRRTPKPIRGSGGNDGSSPNYEFSFFSVFDLNSAWSNPNNAINGSTSGPFASYSGTTRSPLYLPIPYGTVSGTPNLFGTSIFAPWPVSDYTPDDLKVSVYGSATSTGNVEDQKVFLCLASNYVPATDSCTREIEATLPTSTGVTRVPSSYPTFQFAGWSSVPLTGYETGLPFGSRFTAASSIVNLQDGWVMPTLTVGQKVQLHGTWHTVSALGTARQFTVAESGLSTAVLGSVTVTSNVVTGVSVTSGGGHYSGTIPVIIDDPPNCCNGSTAIKATAHANLSGGVITSVTIDNGGAGYSNFSPPTARVYEQWGFGSLGIRVRKKTTTNNTINVGLSYSIAYTPNGTLPANGNFSLCSQVTFPVSFAADGTTSIPTKRGRLCQGIGSTTFWMLADDGETRPLGQIHKADPTSTGIPLSMPWSPFSLTDPYTLIALYVDDSRSVNNQALYEVTYDYATCKFKSWAGNSYSGDGPADCWTWVNKTPHGSTNGNVTEQLATGLASNPIWDPNLFQIRTGTDWALVSVGASYLALTISDFQDNVCFNAIFNTSTYTLLKVFDSFSGALPGMRWGGCHQSGINIYYGAPSVGTWGLSTLTSRSQPGLISGPYVFSSPVSAKSLDGGVTWNSNTSLSPGCIIGSSGCSTDSSTCLSPPWVVTPTTAPITYTGPYGCVSLTNAAYTCSSNTFGVTGPQCVKFKISNDQPCSITGNYSPSSTSGHYNETTKWPCPWNGTYSSPNSQKLLVGDYFSRLNLDGSVDGKAEKFRVLNKASDGAGGWIIEAQRWATCDNPLSDRNDPNNSAVDYYDHLFTGQGGATHPNGWKMYVTSSYACAGTLAWVNLAGNLASTTFKPDNTSITVEHYSLGSAPSTITSSSSETTQVGLSTSRVGTLPSIGGTVPQYNWAGDSSSFNGITQNSGQEMESYPSMVNWTAATPTSRGLSMNWRHLNPATGSSPEAITTPFFNSYTLVGSNKYTYKVGVFAGLGDYKSRPPNVFSAAGAFQSLSGPGSTISDSNPYSYCFVYVPGECVSGSAKGEVYVSAPNAWTEQSGCVADTFKTYTPCVAPLWSIAGWGIERWALANDSLGSRFRRITMGLSGPAAQYQYNSNYGIGNGLWTMTRPAFLSGVRPDMLLYKHPPPIADDQLDRSTYIQTPVAVGTGPQYARVKFGYGDYGTPSQFYCTARAEACVTDQAALPFAYVQSDTLTPVTTCSAGCTIKVPAISGRVMYYTVERSTNGSSWVAGPTIPVAIP